MGRSWSWLLGCMFVACAPPARPVSTPAPSAPRLAPPKAADTGTPAAIRSAPRFAEAPPPPPDFDHVERQKKLVEAFPRLGQRVSEFFDREKPPSLAVAVVVDGQIAFLRVLGVRDRETSAAATENTMYRIGSITKTFTATTVLALRDAALLSLDEPAESYLPELAGIEYPYRDAPRITLRHLLTHTSGLPRLGGFDYTRPDRDVSEEEMLAALARTRLTQSPGVQYTYSNFGLGLVGSLIARRAPQKSFRAAVAHYVTEPYALQHTAFDPKSVPDAEIAIGYAKHTDSLAAPLWRLGASEGAGGLWSTAPDLAHWLAVQLAAWPPRADEDDGPVRRATLREAHTPAFSIGFHAARTERLEADALAVGFTWHVRSSCDYERIVEHSGGVDGFSSSVAFAPERGFGLAVLANSLDTPTAQLENALLRELAPALEPRHAVPAQATLAALQRLAASLGTCDDASYEGLFTPAFRSAVPREKHHAICTELGKLHGACRFGRVRSLETPYKGRFVFDCDHGRVELDAEVESAGDQARFGGLMVRSSGFAPDPKVVRAAQQVLALYGKWNSAQFRQVFAQASDESRVRAAFQAFAPQLGACQLAEGAAQAQRGNGKRGAVLPLRCERGSPTEMVIELDERDKVAGVFATPSGDHPERCSEPHAR